MDSQIEIWILESTIKLKVLDVIGMSQNVWLWIWGLSVRRDIASGMQEWRFQSSGFENLGERERPGAVGVEVLGGVVGGKPRGNWSEHQVLTCWLSHTLS